MGRYSKDDTRRASVSYGFTDVTSLNKFKDLSKRFSKVFDRLETSSNGYKTKDNKYSFGIMVDSNDKLFIAVYHTDFNKLINCGNPKEIWDDIPEVIQKELIFYLDM